MQASGMAAQDLVDPVLACVQEIARRYDRPSAPGILTAGLALDEKGRLPFHQVEAAGERVGFRTRPSGKPAGRFLPSELPAVLALREGGAVVLLEVKAGQARIWDPLNGEEVWADLSDLDERHVRRTIVFEPDPALDRDLQGAGGVQHRPDHWFWSELRKHRPSFIWVGVAAAAVNLLAFAMPLFMMNVYDRIIPNKAAASLWVLALGVVLALTFDYILRTARAALVDEVGREVDTRLSQRLFEKVLNIPLLARSGSTGAFAKRIAEYDSLRDFFTSTTVVLVVDIAFVVVFLGLILALGGLLVLIPLTGVVVMLVAGYVLQKAMTRSLEDAQTDSGLEHSTLVEAIAGVETLKAARGEGRMLSKWRRYSEMNAVTQDRLRRLSAAAVNLSSLCQQAISVGLIVGGYYLFNAKVISMGAIVAIVMVAGRALAPVGQFAFLLTRARQAAITLKALQKVMDAPDEREVASRSIVRTVERGRLELQHLGFRYPEASADALADVQMTIEPGERIGVIGRVASGKSTLGRILSGLYPPSEGALLVDGFDSRQYHPQELRRAFRYVGQEAELFSGTVRDNLMLGAPGDVGEAELLAAAALSGADEFLVRGAAGFDLPVGERGQRLSGGQRSFLALARALVEPFRLLYLDEPTGAMDAQSEALFIDRLGRAIGRDQTLVVSTHRHAMLALVDRLVVIDQGRILADGPKDRVLAQLTALAESRAAPPVQVAKPGPLNLSLETAARRRPA